jgi:DNA helicase II / ATP-dependent DNA helicase PcrA
MRSMGTFSPRPPALRVRRRSLIEVELDPAQRDAVQRPGGSAMLVLGEAGHGKTTVALHRLAHLYHSCATDFRAVVIVPHAGLERLLQRLVTRMGADVNVVSYDRWARWQARRAFGDIPTRESVAVPAGVLRLKRARELRTLLRQLAVLPPMRIDDDEDAPPPPTRALAQRGDLQHLFGDGTRMRWLAKACGAPASHVAAILEHTHVQFLLRGEDEYAHVDADRLVALDHRSLDAGTAAENAASVDPEDYAVLFELDRLRAVQRGVPPVRPRRFDCIVVDEAQEFAPLELTLIRRSLSRGGTLVVAGDADQQTDPAAGFLGWPATNEGAAHARVRHGDARDRLPLPGLRRSVRARAAPVRPSGEDRPRGAVRRRASPVRMDRTRGGRDRTARPDRVVLRGHAQPRVRAAHRARVAR